MLSRTVPVLVAALLVATSSVTPESPPETWVDQIGGPQYFAVLVKDVDASVAWYEQALGLKKLSDQKAENGVWRIVNLSNERLFVEIIRDNRAEQTAGPLGICKVGFGVPDVERVADRVERATGERPRIVDFQRFKLRILQLKDPEGNTIQLTSKLVD